MVKPFRTEDINGFKCRTPEQVQEVIEYGSGESPVNDKNTERNPSASGFRSILIPATSVDAIGMHAVTINSRFARLQKAERQIGLALAVLKDAKRFECLPFDGDGVHREECEYGNCVDADLVDRLLGIFGE